MPGADAVIDDMTLGTYDVIDGLTLGADAVIDGLMLGTYAVNKENSRNYKSPAVGVFTIKVIMLR